MFSLALVITGRQRLREWAISCAICLAMEVFSGTGGGVLHASVVTFTSSSFPSLKTSSDSSERETRRRCTPRSSSSVTAGRGVARGLRKAEESEWWRRGGLGLRGGLVLGEGSGLGVLSDWELEADPDLGSGKMTGREICRDSLLMRAWGDMELDLGRNFQPRGSWPVMTDVWTGGGEEQEEVEDEEEEEDGWPGEPKTPMGGQE